MTGLHQGILSIVRRNRLDEEDVESIAEELSVPVTEVRRAIHSFFGIINDAARSLPFDDRRKIFSREKFEEYSAVWNIPSIGRIGPVYSRYLKWRGNEAKRISQDYRSNYRKRITQDDIEHMAGDILSGKTPSPVIKKKGSELYERIWLVGKNKKKLARQVIPKEKE